MTTRFTALALTLALTGAPLASWAAAGPRPKATSVASVSAHNRYVELTLGKATIVRLNGPASRVSISDPAVVGIVVISPTEVELIGKAAGVANLLIWSERSGRQDLTIDLAVHHDVTSLNQRIKALDPGINVIPMAADDSVILTGTAESAQKAELAYDLARAFFDADSKVPTGASDQGTSSYAPGSAGLTGGSAKIINLIRVKGQPATKAELVEQRLKDIDSRIKLNLVPGSGGKEKAILTGRVRNATMVAKAINLASIFYGTPGIKLLSGPGGNLVKEGKEGDAGTFQAGVGAGLIGNLAGNVLHGSIISDQSGNVVSMLEIEERPQVKCSIKFLEVRRSRGSTVGGSVIIGGNNVRASSFAGSRAQNLSTGTAGVPLSPRAFIDQITGLPAGQIGVNAGRDFSAFLGGLLTNGQARVLAEPTISSLSGEPSTFLSGGEFPIPFVGANGSVTVLFKEFGIRLNLLPTVTDRGTIHMQISPEVSDLDKVNGVNINNIIIPALRTRRSQTVLEMHDGDNFVLSGLYNQSTETNFSKTPFLGQIPILGNLFRSRDFQRGETELVIVIHPEIQWGLNMTAEKPEYPDPRMSPQTPAPNTPPATSQGIQTQDPSVLKALEAFKPATPEAPAVSAVPQTAAPEAPKQAETQPELEKTAATPPSKKALKAMKKAQEDEDEAVQKLYKRQHKKDRHPDKVKSEIGTIEPSVTVTAGAAAPVAADAPQAMLARVAPPMSGNANSQAQAETITKLLDSLRLEPVTEPTVIEPQPPQPAALQPATPVVPHPVHKTSAQSSVKSAAAAPTKPSAKPPVAKKRVAVAKPQLVVPVLIPNLKVLLSLPDPQQPIEPDDNQVILSKGAKAAARRRSVSNKSISGTKHLPQTAIVAAPPSLQQLQSRLSRLLSGR